MGKMVGLRAAFKNTSSSCKQGMVIEEIERPAVARVRSEEEFSYAGEANIRRPADPAALSDREWGEYLHFRRNPRGVHAEMWFHAAGCRRYFNVLRDTVSYEVHATGRIGEELHASAREQPSGG